MDSTAQSRKRKFKGLISLYGGLCLALAFMICAWGTSYKLSLYKVEGTLSFAPAKVCTRGSDAAKSAVDHAANAQDLVQIPVLAAALFSLDEASEIYPVKADREQVTLDRSPLSRAPILYLRPPPDERHSLD